MSAHPTLTARYWAPGEFPSGTNTVLNRATKRWFIAELRHTGGGGVELPNTCVVMPETGGMITFDLNDTRAFATRCGKRRRVTIAKDGAKAQRTTWELTGHLSVLKKGLLYPANGLGAFPPPDTISYNWTHPLFDQSAWTVATSMSSVADAKLGQINEWGTMSPLGPWDWSSEWAESNALTADIIGPDDGSVTNVSSPNAPHQHHYFRQVIAVGGGSYRMAFSVDNYGEVYVDGVLLGSYNDWKHLTWFDLDLEPGFHVVAVHVANFPVSLANPCGYSWAMYQTGGGFVAKSVAADTVHVEYQASPPGMSWGQTWSLALQPHIDNGESWALALDRDFDPVYDSLGNPWDTSPNITMNVGQSLLDLWLKGQQSYIDGYMDPSSYLLRAVGYGGFAPDSGFALTDAENITSLIHDTEESPGDKLLIRSDASGWSEVGTGESGMVVHFGIEVAPGDVASQGQTVLDLYGADRVAVSGEFIPADLTQVPWVNSLFTPGSFGTAPDLDGAPASERFLSLGATLDASDENVRITFVQKDRIQDINERLILELTD